ncbi:MAG: serine/threonine-protein kinase [Planctomycetaceae bacterium]
MDPSVSHLLSVLSSNGILPEQDFRRISDRLTEDCGLKSMRTIADELVAAGRMTRFQADRMCNGMADKLVLGNYLLMEPIGQGGMGEVFRAYHMVMRKERAIKLVLPSATDYIESVKRFRHEIKVSGELSHPNIVVAHDAGQEAGHYYLVMDLIEGSDLGKLVRKHGPLRVEQAIDYVTQAARGLEYAHSRGVIHRDVKPSNLFLDNSGVVKVLDLGLSRLHPGLRRLAEGANVEESVTEPSLAMGTINYMAPEQASSPGEVDGRADVYSLGCTLYYLLTGWTPYHEGSDISRLFAHREKAIPSLLDSRANVSKHLDDVYRKMMAKSPVNRYQSMTEVIGALQDAQLNLREIIEQPTQPAPAEILDDSMGATTPMPDVSPQSSPSAARWLFAPLVMALVALIWWISQPPSSGGGGSAGGNGGSPQGIAELPAPSDTSVPITITSTTDLVQALNLEQVLTSGEGWRFEDGKLLTPPDRITGNIWLEFPHTLPARFTASLEVTRTSGQGALIVGVPLGDGNSTVLLLDRKGAQGFDSMINSGADDGKVVERHTFPEPLLPVGEVTKVDIRVDHLGLEVRIGDQQVLIWPAPLDDLQQGAGWQSHGDEQIFVGTHAATQLVFSSIVVTPLTE